MMITKIREGMSGKTVAEIIDGNFEYLENKQDIKFDEQNTYLDGKLNEYEEQLKEFAENKFVEVDEDDLTIDAGKAKFTDREYVADSNTGMGYKILRRRIYNNTNLLVQADFDSENTIYELRYAFDLAGLNITLPSNCILKFDGGTISNGVLDLNGALVEPANHPMSDYFTNTLEVSGFKQGQTFFSEDAENVIYWDGEDWRNTDGTLVSKVTII